MQMVPFQSVRHEFTRRARLQRAEEQRFVEQVRRKDEKDKAREQERADSFDDLMDMTLGFVIATDAQIAAFTVKLDVYDAATIEALMANEQRMAEVQAELDALLAKAYVLPDGRRVFKTEDGMRVFDEHGVEVKNFDPELIEDWRPYWNTYDEPFKEKFALVNEREDLIEFQNVTDDARAEAGEDGVTQERLDELEEILTRNAPDAMKLRAGRALGLAQEQQAPDSGPAYDPQSSTATGFAAKLDAPNI